MSLTHKETVTPCLCCLSWFFAQRTLEAIIKRLSMVQRTPFFFLLLVGGIISWTAIGCAGEQTSEEKTTNVEDSASEINRNHVTDTPEISVEPDSLAIPLRTPEGSPARFAFPSGSILMEYSGDFRGIRQITFDQYGLREQKLDSAVPANKIMQVIPPYLLSILTPEYYGVVDLRAKTGEKAKNLAYQHYMSLPEYETTAYGEIALQRSPGKRLADTLLQGIYHCRVYQHVTPRYTHTIWVWGGVPIREKLTLLKEQQGSYVLEPVAVTTHISVPDSLFTFPNGVTVSEIEPPPIK